MKTPKILIIVEIERGDILSETDFPNVIKRVSPTTAPKIKRFPNNEFIVSASPPTILMNKTPKTAIIIPKIFLDDNFSFKNK